MKLLTCILALMLAIGLAQGNFAFAQGGINLDTADPEAIQAELNRLRVFYKDTHPDIQRLKVHLKRALEEQEIRRKKKAEERAAAEAGSESKAEPDAPGQTQEGQKNSNTVIPKTNLPSP